MTDLQLRKFASAFRTRQLGQHLINESARLSDVHKAGVLDLDLEVDR